MISQEVLRKIREIEIKARRLVSATFMGAASSAQKGTGFEFDQLREYQQGDDVRAIDWKSSARANKILIKQYIEERNRTIIIMLDVSGSMGFASQSLTKSDIAGQIAALLALVGDYGKDRVGLLIFSDQIHSFLPPKKGKTWVRQIIYEIFSQRPNHAHTNINAALAYINKYHYKNAHLFLISDFIDKDYDKNLGIAAAKHDLVAIRIVDPFERSFANAGILYVKDSETGFVGLLDSRNQQKLNGILDKHLQDQDAVFKKYGTDVLQIVPQENSLNQVVNFFAKKMRY
ncbi:hypothetical protein Noda2021_03260 [Candidatus Dependentiae bacterium Noda2021]|nr:hypothetical protein Noda2021_03260 [Candidatus Dependentiae bacterium Noda2021]